ncbi:MAG: hypothetical protein WCP68_18405 [Enhydrobacter sp.]
MEPVPAWGWQELRLALPTTCSTENHSALEHRTGDHAITSITTMLDSPQPAAEISVDLSLVNWFYPIETEVCARARGIIGELIGGEPDAEREQRTAKPSNSIPVPLATRRKVRTRQKAGSVKR